jgi:hypothetical protein
MTMQPRRLEDLGERLLRAGVAPRHVRRFIGELRDHYDDIVQERLVEGASRAGAEEAAWARLGDEERLTQSILARPEVRSFSARFPGIVFGAGALFLWIGALALVLLAIAVLPEISGKPLAVFLFCYSFARIFPIVAAFGLLAAAARQRLASRWPYAGAAMLACLGGTTSVSFGFHAGTDGASSISMEQSMIPFLFPFTDVLGPRELPVLAEGIARGFVLLAVSFVAHLIWSRYGGFLRHPVGNV